MLGGVGILIAVALFFAWKDSPSNGKRTVAWVAGAWAVASIFCILALILANGN